MRSIFASLLIFCTFSVAGFNPAHAVRHCSALVDEKPSSKSLFAENARAQEKIRILSRLQAENRFVEIELHSPSESRVSNTINIEWIVGKITGIKSSYGTRYLHIDDRFFPLTWVKGVRIMGTDTDALSRLPMVLFPVDMARERRLSGVSERQWNFLTRNGAEVVSITEWLAQYESYEDSVALGIDDQLYDMMARMARLQGFKPLYDRLGIDPDSEVGHTHEFMSRIHNRIVFFMPRNLMDYETPVSMDGTNITRDEFVWLYRHPYELHKVTFVLGGQQAVYFRDENVAPRVLRSIVQRSVITPTPSAVVSDPAPRRR